MHYLISFSWQLCGGITIPIDIGGNGGPEKLDNFHTLESDPQSVCVLNMSSSPFYHTAIPLGWRLQKEQIEIERH